MPTISTAINAIAANVNKFGNTVKTVAPALKELKAVGNIQQRVTTGLCKTGPRRADRLAGEQKSRGQVKTTNSRSSAPPGIGHIGRESGIGADESTAAAAVEDNSSRPLIDPNEFKENFKQASMESLFAAAGKNSDTLRQLLDNSTNEIVKIRLPRIATAYHLALLAKPSGESAKKIDAIMADLTKMMVNDKLGRKSIFGTHQPSREKDYNRVKHLEKQLMAVLSATVGEGTLSAGNFLFAQGVKPFIADYVDQQLGGRLSPEAKADIQQYIDNNAWRLLSSVRGGINNYLTDSIENVGRDIDMILIIPHLLNDMINDVIDNPPPTSLTVPPDDQSPPEPSTRPADGGGVESDADKPRNDQTRSDGPPHAGNTYNNYIYSPNNSTYSPINFTFSPTNIVTNNGDKRTDATGSYPDRADAATDPAPMRTQGPDSPLSGTAAQSTVVTDAPVSTVISSQPIIAAAAQFAASLTRAKGQDSPLSGTAAQSTVVTDAPMSTVISSQPIIAAAAQFAASLTRAKGQDSPLSGTAAQSTVVTDAPMSTVISSRPVTAAAAQFAAPLNPPSEAPAIVQTAPPALQSTPTTVPARSPAAAQPQPAVQSRPVVLSNQGIKLSQHPRTQPIVNHFVPMNQPKEALAPARDRLKKDGPGYVSPRLDAVNSQTKGTAAGTVRAAADNNGLAGIAAQGTVVTDAPMSTVIHSQPVISDVAQFAASLTLPSEAPAIVQTARSRLNAAAPALQSTPTTAPARSPAAAQPQPAIQSRPVVLSNQGIKLSQHPRTQPIVNHFAPLNQPKEALAPARDRLKKDGPGYVSPRLDAFNPQTKDTAAGTVRAAADNNGLAGTAAQGTAVTDTPMSTVIHPQPITTAAPALQSTPTRSRTAVQSQPTVLSAQGLRRPNHSQDKSAVNHFVPMNKTPEVWPTLANGKTDHTSKLLAAFKTVVNDKHIPQVTGSRIARAQVRYLPQSDIDQPAPNDKPASKVAAPATILATAPTNGLTTGPTNPQAARQTQPTVLSAQGLRRPNHSQVKSAVNHFVPMDKTPEVWPTLANGKTDHTSKLLAAFKPGADDSEKKGKN